MEAAKLSLDILGCMIVHPETFTSLIEVSIFEGHEAKSVFRLMEGLKKEKTGWNLTLLHDLAPQELKSTITLATRDSNELIYCPSLLPHYLTRLKLETLKEKTADIIKSFSNDPFTLFEKLKDEINLNRPQSQCDDLTTIASNLMKQLEKASMNPGEISGVTSGFKGLDNVTWGFQPSRLYLIAGRPSMGKSCLGMNIAYNAARSGKRVYVQSLEESSQAFMTRMLSLASGIEVQKLFRGQLNEGQWGHINYKLNDVVKMPLIINESVGISSKEIVSNIRREKEKVDLVIIDHIQQIREKEQNRHLELSKAAFTIKEMAKELQVPVIVMCQLNRGVEMRSDKHPMMSDLKESGDLEAIADVVMLLYRESYYEPACLENTKVEVGVAKNRDGKTGNVNLYWNSEIMTFSDY